MKSRSILLIAFAGVVCAGIIISCSKSNNNSTDNNTSTNKAILTNIGNTIIIPSFQNLSTAVNAMDAAIVAFNASPTTITLTAAQSSFKDAYLAWEACSEFSFGPASDQSLVTSNVNVFPTTVSTIQSNINSGVYIIDAIGNLNAQGFPALDYLLFSPDNTTVLARFTTDSKAANAKQYLAAVSGGIKSKATAVLNAWLSTGSNYISQFINATGVDAGSSLSLLVNGLVYDYDVILKNYKIGIPFGKYGPTTLPQDPTKVEAYYSGISVQLLIAQVQAIQNIYLGASGQGLDDKVASTNIQKNGSPLNDVIKAEFTTLLTKLQALPASLSGAIQNNSSTVNDAYTEVQKLVVLLKVDMSSALGVKISFQDDDGD